MATAKNYNGLKDIKNLTHLYMDIVLKFIKINLIQLVFQAMGNNILVFLKIVFLKGKIQNFIFKKITLARKLKFQELQNIMDIIFQYYIYFFQMKQIFLPYINIILLGNVLKDLIIYEK